MAVNLDPGQSADDVGAFLDAADGSALARTSDARGELARTFGMRALGTLVVLDDAGQVVYTSIDPPAEEITAAVEKADA